MSGRNRAEEFVYQICQKSFLSLWSYANPRGKKNKELCDVLVVCEPDIIIVSVKDIKLTDSGDEAVDWERWQKRAIEESCQQIYGAERWIEKAEYVIRKDGMRGLRFPTHQRRIHRIAVALGSQGKVSLKFGDFGKGFVHVFDEISFHIILRELNTISDFIEYLLKKETFIRSQINIVMNAPEEDLLAIYLHKGRSFPEGYKTILIDGGLWKEFIAKSEYKSKQLADKVSFAWDEVIELFCKDALEDTLEFGFGASLTDAEMAIRVMSREDRFSRRILGREFLTFLNQTQSRSRIVPSPSQIIFVYLSSFDEDRNYVQAELGSRCFITRGLKKDCRVVVGIAVERSKFRQGFALDLFYLDKPIWSSEDQAQLEYLQEISGYFTDPIQTALDEDEYPSI